MRSLMFLLLLTAAAAAAAPDFTALPFQELRKAWLQEKSTLDSARARVYRELLEARRAEAEAEYKEKTAARNVRGMSIARKIRDQCDEALASIQSNGTFTVPGPGRRELEEWVGKLAGEKTAADRQADASLAKLREKYRGRLGEILARDAGGTAPPPAELDILLDTLIKTEPPKPAGPTPDATHAPPAAGANAWGAASNTAAQSPWFACSAEGDGWFTAGRWKAEMLAQSLFAIPILNVTSSYQSVKEDPLSGQSSSFSYEMVKPLTTEGGKSFAFRLKRMPNRKTVALLSWPGPENRGRLEFRTQPAPVIPSPHGFELEARIVTQARTGPEPVDVRVETDPPRAGIRLNGKLVVDVAGVPALTPVRLRIPPGSYTIGLALENHVTKVFEKWAAQPDAILSWKFQHETNLPPVKTVRVDSTRKWTPAELQVSIGDRMWLIPSGQWTIGHKSELCGAEGYPEGPRFSHYYGTGAVPSQKDDAPYGALLMRVGFNVDPIAVTNTACVRVPATGWLFFDVNEKPEKEFRKDNRGQLTVKIIVIPMTR